MDSRQLQYQESGGGNVLAKGSQDMGKTLLLVHTCRELVKNWGYTTEEIVGNVTLYGELSGSLTLKGEQLRDYLWRVIHVPYRHKIIIIDEIDTEFPARFFTDREQTEIATRLWHNKKLRNWFLYSEHLGRGTDVIFDLAANFELIPHGVNFTKNELEFTLINGLDLEISNEVATDIIATCSMYNRWELTENTEEDVKRVRPSILRKLKQQKKGKDFELESPFPLLNDELEV